MQGSRCTPLSARDYDPLTLEMNDLSNLYQVNTKEHLELIPLNIIEFNSADKPFVVELRELGARPQPERQLSSST